MDDCLIRAGQAAVHEEHDRRAFIRPPFCSKTFARDITGSRQKSLVTIMRLVFVIPSQSYSGPLQSSMVHPMPGKGRNN